MASARSPRSSASSRLATRRSSRLRQTRRCSSPKSCCGTAPSIRPDMTYEIYGRTLESGMPLPELPEARDEARMTRRVPLIFERRLPAAPGGGWFDLWPSSGVRAARTADGYHVRYSGSAEFQIDARGLALSG